jgi:hypothetical protein
MHSDNSTIIPRTFIYGLIDPETGKIRYIGKANDPELRLKRHFISQELNANTHKARWLRNLVSKGLRPILTILETVSVSEWQSAEIRWISEMKARGENLTNSTFGGEGIHGLKHTEQAREKISSALRKRVRLKSSYEKSATKLRGRSISDEQRAKLSKSQKARWANMNEEERRVRLDRIPREWTAEKRQKQSNSQRGLKKNIRSSAFVGACWFKRDGCWRANIKVGDKQVHLGYYVSEIDAAIAYNHGALKYYGTSAKFNNIPGWEATKPQRFSTKHSGQMRMF